MSLQDTLAQDWAYLPIPSDPVVFERLVEAGDKVATLPDPAADADHVMTALVGADRVKHLGVVCRRSGGPVDATDLEVAGSYYGAAKGDWRPRAFSDQEEASFEWGNNTGDLYINGEVYFANVPVAVWRFELGGYPYAEEVACLPAGQSSRRAPAHARRGAPSAVDGPAPRRASHSSPALGPALWSRLGAFPHRRGPGRQGLRLIAARIACPEILDAYSVNGGGPATRRTGGDSCASGGHGLALAANGCNTSIAQPTSSRSPSQPGHPVRACTRRPWPVVIRPERADRIRGHRGRRRHLGHGPAIRPPEPEHSVGPARDLVALLVDRAVMPAAEEREVRERGGAPVRPVVEMMPLAIAHAAAGEAAAPVAVAERSSQGGGNRPRPRPDFEQPPLRVLPHHHPAGIARQAAGRFL
jgi:hypothetical protein